MTLRFIDLFCGIGGFRVALEKSGHQCIFSCDIDRKVQLAYKDNFGETPAGDLTKIPNSQIPPHDILCAGFPCQSFSISGKHSGINDPRGQLFFEIVRIAAKHKPPIILMENVKNILTIDSSRVINTIKQELDDLGYEVFYDSINSSLNGIPQKRERVYFVCIRKGSGIEYDRDRATENTYKKIYLKSILMDKDACKDLIVRRKDMVLKQDASHEELKPIRIGHVNKASQGERIYSTNGHSVTISATTGGAGANTGLYLVDDEVRRLHIDECKKLMGFPLKHKVTPGRGGYKQMGNAVIPPMIEKVFSSISL